jgi:hypothetical protein
MEDGARVKLERPGEPVFILPHREKKKKNEERKRNKDER